MRLPAEGLQIQVTGTFQTWLEHLRDRQARARIQARLDRAVLGNLGDTRALGGGLHEMRIDHGPGYRLYFLRRGTTLIILLCGGDKGTQGADIAWAKPLAKEVP